MASTRKNPNDDLNSNPGEGVRQQIAIDLIKVDYAFQPRVLSIDDDHVTKLDHQYRKGFDLPPALIVFLIGTVYYLVDGFHRLKALKALRYVDKRDQSYSQPWCIVYTGTREQAIEMAIAENLLNKGKPLGHEDRRRGCMLLLDSEEWRKKSDRSLSDYLGISLKIIYECKLRWSELNNEPLPEIQITRSGGIYPRKRRKRNSDFLPRMYQRGNGPITANMNRKTIILGNDPDLAASKLRALVSQKESVRRFYEQCTNIDYWLISRGILSETVVSSGMYMRYPGMYGRRIGSEVTFTWESFKDNAATTSSAARALWLKQRVGSTRTVVLCPVEDGPAELMDDFRKMGVEWMTIDDFFASLQPFDATPTPDEVKADE